MVVANARSRLFLSMVLDNNRSATRRGHAARFLVTLLLVSLSTAVLSAIGCGSSKQPLVPVSGVVTLNGKPIDGARVLFEPESTGDVLNVGPSSYAVTDEQGRYSLETMDGEEGAVVAHHRVTISTFMGPEEHEGEEPVREELIPERYFDGSTPLSWDVSTDGTTAADFQLSP